MTNQWKSNISADLGGQMISKTFWRTKVLEIICPPKGVGEACTSFDAFSVAPASWKFQKCCQRASACLRQLRGGTAQNLKIIQGFELGTSIKNNDYMRSVCFNVLQHAWICFNMLQSADLMKVIEKLRRIIENPMEILGHPNKINDKSMKGNIRPRISSHMYIYIYITIYIYSYI